MSPAVEKLLSGIRGKDPRAIARAISLVEDGDPAAEGLLAALDQSPLDRATTVGITGPGGAGKSTLTQQLIAHYRAANHRVGVVAIDPSSPISGGALLGDRVRMMHHALDPQVVIRSMATRGRIGGLCASAGAAVRIMAASGCNPVIVETVGVGQAEIDVVRLTDLTVLVLAPGLGDDIQAMKAGLVELADILVVNKSDRLDAEALAMEMEPVARERGRRLCRTCAADGRGVPELAATIDETHCGAGQTLRERRARCRRAEVLDWALEMIRPQLSDALGDLGELRGDPRANARRLLETVGLHFPNPSGNKESSP
ncbi:MAG: methylmalonyl Co-A mutase-associated GTPase MeaB [Myxococcales bacterium]